MPRSSLTARRSSRRRSSRRRRPPSPGQARSTSTSCLELSGDEPANAVLPGPRAPRPRPSCRGAASAAQLASRSPNPIA
eukprot:1977661-Prymnesium_polylepis.1